MWRKRRAKWLDAAPAISRFVWWAKAQSAVPTIYQEGADRWARFRLRSRRTSADAVALPTLRVPDFFLTRCFATDFAGAVFPAGPFPTFFALSRFFTAARCAAPSAALAHWLSSSVSSNSRAGNCQ